MGSLLVKRRSPSPGPRPPLGWGARKWRVSGAPEEMWFVPARWLVIAVAIARLLLIRGSLAKVGAVGLLWSFAPRKLKMVTVGLAATATIMIAGAVAAIALLALQLS
jgi:uncharacterized membrane protein